MYMFGATEATIPGVFGFNTNYVSTQMQNSYIAASGYEDEGVVEPYWLVITSAAAVSNSVEDTCGIGNYEDLETLHNGGDTL